MARGAPPGYPLQVRPRARPAHFGLSAPIPCRNLRFKKLLELLQVKLNRIL
jgi:hypothetical protein